MGSVLDSLLNPGPTQEVVDPETGLPQSQVAENKLREESEAPMSLYGTQSDMSAGVDPTGASRTARADAKTFGDAAIGAEELNRNLVIDDNFQDLAAHQQSWADKWGNGLTKMVGKTGTAVVGGIGMIGSSIYALGNGEFSKIYDNAFHSELDAFDAWLDGKLPNYVSKEEEENSFFQNMLTANFWAGDLFGNVVPFVAGAILTEVAITAATAGFGTAPATAALAAKATNIFSKVSQGVRAAAKGKAALTALAKGAMYGKRLKQASSLTRKMVTGAGYEAGVEARHHINTLKDEFTADFIRENGRAPGDEERAEIHDLATQSGNWVFTGNLALVGGGHLLQFPKIFGPGIRSMGAGKSVGTILKTTAKEAGEAVVKPYKAAYQSWSKGRNLVDAGYHALKNPVYEGLIEEGGQGWINNAGHHNASKFWAQKHDPSGVEYGLGMIESLGATFEESYGTKGAWKEIGMGMIVGGLGIPGYVRTGKKSKSGKDARKFEIQGGAIGALRDRKEKRERTDRLANKFNENPDILKSMKAGAQNYARTVRLQEEKDGALMENDIFTYKNAENDEFHSFVTSRIEAGMYQDVVDNIKEIEELSDEEFINDFGYAEVAQQEQWSADMIAERKQKVMQSALTKAAKIKKVTDIVDGKFQGVQGWSQAELTKAISQFGHHLSGQSTVQDLNDLIREQLIHSASTIENVDIREEELIAKLDELTGGALRTGEDASAESFQEQMRASSLESNGARVKSIMKRLSDSDKLADNDPNKLTEQQIEFYTAHLANLQQAIAMGQQENSIDDDAHMEKFKENNPKEFGKVEKREEALGLLRDLRKLRARRQEFLGYYNGLFTKEGQQEALTQVEFFMDQNSIAANKLAQEEAAKALQEGNDKKFREATEGIEFKVFGLNAEGEQTEGFYTWVPDSPTELFNVKDSSKKLTIDDLRTHNKDGSSSLNEGVTPLTPLQTEKRLIREAIARIKETDPAKIIATEKALEGLNAKIIDLAERLEKLNLTANNKNVNGIMQVPAGTIATKGKQKGKNIGGQIVKNSEVLDVIEETTEKIATVTAQRDKLRLDLELFRENAVMLDEMLKESGEGPMVSPFQRSLEQRVALEKAIKEEGLRKLGISGTTLDAEQVDRDGSVIFEAQERRSNRLELTTNAENAYYSTAEVLEEVSAMIAQQESNLEALSEKNEVLKEAILDDSFLSLMQEFQKDNEGVDPQDPAAFIAYTNQILENGAESVTKDSRKWKGKDRDYWNATAERHAELLAAKPNAMKALYSRYAELRDAKEQANLMLDEFYATEAKIENLKQTIERDKVREARLIALEGRKAEGLGKVQRSIIFGSGYVALQKMLETIGREEAAQEALLKQTPTADQPQVNSSTGDIYMDDVYGKTVTNEAGEEVPQESPTEVFEKGSDPKNQDGGADNNRQYKPDASEVGYGKTAGIDRADKITNQDPKHMSPSQRTFFRFIDDIKGAKYDIKNYKLRAVSLKNNPYPELEKDFVTKDADDKAINNEDPKTASILLVVVDKNGDPIKLRGPSGKNTEFVFTNMLLPDPSGDRFSGIGGETGISQEAWGGLTDQYTASRQAVLNSEGGITFNITGFSKGMPNLETIDGEYVKGSVVGRLVNRVEDVKGIRLQVATNIDPKTGRVAIAMGTTSYKARLGMIYAHHKSRPVPMELRLVNDTEIETVMQILMGHGRAVYSADPAISSASKIIPGTDNISVFDRLHDLIKFGEWKNKGKTHAPKYSIYLETKNDERYIVFAGERILLQSIDPSAAPRTDITVVDGKAVEETTPVYNPENAQKLRDFLATKIHNVNLKTLNSKEKYTGITINSEGEVTTESYENYGEYLMKPRATMSDTPLTTSLVPMVNRGEKGEGVDHTQFKFTYLKYDLGHYAKPTQAPAAPEAPVKIAGPEAGTDISDLIPQANAISDPSMQSFVGIRSTDLVFDKKYNLVVTPVGKDPVRVQIIKREGDLTISPVEGPGFGNSTITTIMNEVNDNLKKGIPFEVSITLIKKMNPGVTANFTFEELDNPIPAPISAEVKEQGKTVEEAVVAKTTGEVINIYAGTGENASLSNFANRPFNADDQLNGVRFNTVEGAFQASKLLFSEEYMEENPEKKGGLTRLNAKGLEMQSKLQTATGAEAKSLGRQVTGLDVTLWDASSSEIMTILLLESFEQNPTALRELLATGSATLTHTQDKGKWGKEFPKILMEVREELGDVALSTYKEAIPGEVKEGVVELFKSNLELAKLGTPQQYSAYLDTVFPDSQVKDIVYRGDKSTDYEVRGGVFGRGIYFSSLKSLSQFHADKIKGKVNTAILNFKNPDTNHYFNPDFTPKKGYISITNLTLEEQENIGINNDSVVGLRADLSGEIKEYVAKDIKQIHILGSKKDIQGFKKYATQPTSEVETTAEESDYEIPELGENPDDSPFLLASSVNMAEEKQANIAQELAWFEETFPFIPISTVPGLIEGIGYGQTIKAARVILSQLAVEGTVYHEGWHVIEGRFISAEHRAEVYAAFSRLTGIKEGVSEEIAEEFRTWMLTDGKFLIGKGTKKDQTLLQRFFQAIKDFINLLLGKGPKKDQELLQNLFKSIKNGRFTTPHPDAKFTGEAKQFKRLKKADGTLVSSVQSVDFIETIVGNMFKVLFSGDVKNISMPDLLNLSSAQHSDLLAARVDELMTKSIQGYITNLKKIINTEGINEASKAEAFNLLNTVGSQPNPFWNVLKQGTFEWLQKYKVEIDPLEDVQDETKKLRDSVSMVASNEINVKQMAPAIIKLLMATLPAGKSRTGVNSVLGEGIVNSRKFFNLVMQELASTESFAEQIDKLRILMDTHPEFAKPILHLVARLKGTEKWPIESLTPNEFRMQQQFRQQFHKAYSEDFMALVDEDTGAIKFIRTNADRKSALTIEEFRSNLKVLIRNEEGPFRELENGDIYIDMDAKMNLNGKQLTLQQFSEAASAKDSLPFLKYFGIEIENSENLSTAELDTIYQSLHGEGGTGIVSELLKLGVSETPIDEFFSSQSGAFTRLKKIIDIQAKRTTKTVDLQHQAADGKTNYSVILNNFASNIIGRLNNGRIPNFLLDRNGNILESVQGSLFLEGSAGGLQIGFGAISGFKIENSRHGKILEDASPRRIFQTEFTSVLTGNIPLLRAAEKKTEFALNLKKADSNGNSIYQMMPKTKSAYAEQMLRYLRMEIFKSKISAGNNISGYRDVKGKLRLFEYLPIDLESIGGVAEIDAYLEENKDELLAAIIAKLNARSEAVLKAATKNGVFVDYGNGKYGVRIEPAILKELGISGTLVKGRTTIERAEALKIAERFEMLHSVGAIEQTVTILGDVGFFKRNAFFKRTSGPVGPKKFASNSARINVWLNEHRKRKDGKISDGKFNILTYADVKGSISTDVFMEYALGSVSPTGLSALQEFFELSPEEGNEIGMEGFLQNKLGSSPQTQRDIANINLLLPYLNYDEADAQGYITLDEYMEFMERVGDVTASMRAAYAKVQAGTKLSKAEMAVFTPLKPQYFGPSSNAEIYSPIFLKLSLLPVYPQLFAHNPEGPLSSMYEDMVSKQVGITVFESGVKIGGAVDENGSFNSFYTPEGEYSGIQNGLIQELDYEYFGVQVEMGEKVKDKTTKGSQNRALLVANAYDSGEIAPGRENIAKADAELSVLENETNDVNFQLLKDEFGIKETEDGDFSIDEDGAIMFAALLRDEGVRREMDDAYLDGIDEFLNSSTKVLDALGNKKRIENLLFSLVSNRVVRSKIHGGAKVQVASTGFEQGVRTFEDVPAVYQDKHKFGSNVRALGFYRRGPEGSKTLAMEVMLPHYFKELIGGDVQVRNGVVYKDGVAIGSNELLEIYGYRIPTSALNSIEAIIVVGFLPQEAGEAIMVPSEIVVKAGSDYDIDKLTLYFPNYEWSKRDNKLTKVQYLTPENSSVSERIEQLRRLDPKKYELLGESLGIKGIKEEFGTLSNNLRVFKKELRNNASSEELEFLKRLEAQKQKVTSGKETKNIDFLLGVLGANIFKDVENIDNATQKLKEVIKEHNEKLQAFNDAMIDALSTSEVSIPSQNAQKAIDNRIIELSRDIVLDPANFDQLIRPVSADRLKGLAGKINTARGVSNAAPEFSEMLEFEKVLEMANRFWGGKAGLGMAAVANTHQIKAQKAGLGLVLTEGRALILDKFNTFDFRVDENGTPFMSLGNTYDVNRENLISEIIGEFINAFVDVANDPFVFDINANLATFSAYIGLLRTGVPIAEAAAFISQPSIRKFAEDIQNFPGARLKELMEGVQSEYTNLASAFEGKIDAANELTSIHSLNNSMSILEMEPGIKALEEARESGMSIEDSLTLAGITSQEAFTYYTAQSILVSDFYALKTKIGSPIGKVSSAIKSDRSSGTARSRAHARLQIKEQEALWLKGDYINLDKYIGEESYMRSFNDVQEQSSRLFNSVFVSDRIPEGAAIVDKLIQRAVNSNMPFEDKLRYVDLVEHHFVAYILGTVPGSVGEAMHKDAVRLMQGKGKDILSLPRRIKALQQKLAAQGEKSLILDELFPILETGDNASLEFKTEGLKRFSKQMASQDRNILIEDMGILMAADPQLAEDIVKFAILQSGNMTSPISFTDLIPADVMAQVIGPILENYLDGNYTIDVQSFEDQFVQNIFMNPIASDQYRKQYIPQDMQGERVKLKDGEVKVIVNSDSGPYATRGMPTDTPPAAYITVTGISSAYRREGGYTPAEKAELKLKGKKTTLTRIFKLGPNEMAKWVKIQEYKKKFGKDDYYKKMPGALKSVRWNEMPRKGDGMRFTEYGPKNSLSIIGENNTLLDKSNATPETQNTELKERLVGDAVKTGNILDMKGIPIIPVAKTGMPTASDIAREAAARDLLTRKNRKESFKATKTSVSARIKEDFSDEVNNRMFMAAIGNIESLVKNSPNLQFLMPPLGLRLNDGGTTEEISARVELLHNLAKKFPNLTIVLDDAPLMFEEAHMTTITDMFNCK